MMHLATSSSATRPSTAAVQQLRPATSPAELQRTPWYGVREPCDSKSCADIVKKGMPPPGPAPSNGYQARPSGNPQVPPNGPQSFGQGAPQGYAFRYSNCTGRRKALLIGINYFGQRGQLRGCINDVRNMTAYLVEQFGYKREDMVILTDDQQNPMSQPTKQNILRAMHWLVKDARPNDSLFFHYSGKFLLLLLTPGPTTSTSSELVY